MTIKQTYEITTARSTGRLTVTVQTDFNAHEQLVHAGVSEVNALTYDYFSRLARLIKQRLEAEAS